MKKHSILLLFTLAFIFGCKQEQEISQNSDLIRLNQIGYYPVSVKQFVVVDTLVKSFDVVDDNGMWFLVINLLTMASGKTPGKK